MGVVDEEQPQRRKDQHGGEAHSLREGADHQGWRDDRERALEGEEEHFGNRAGERVAIDTGEEGFPESADEGAESDLPLDHARRVEGERVTAHQPQDRHQTRQREALHQHRQHVLRAYESAIEEGETRDRHEEDQRRGGEDPRGIARVQGIGCARGRGARNERGEREGDLREEGAGRNSADRCWAKHGRERHREFPWRGIGLRAEARFERGSLYESGQPVTRAMGAKCGRGSASADDAAEI